MANFGFYRSVGTRSFATVLVCLFLALSVSGCLSPRKDTDPNLACVLPAGENNTSLVSFFLNLRRPDGPHLNLEINSVEISGNGFWTPISLATKGIDTKKIGAGQVALGRTNLTAGAYEKIRLTFSPEATITQADTPEKLQVIELQVEIPFNEPFNLLSEASDTFLISWDVEASLDTAPGPTLIERLVMDVTLPLASPITANRIYVACPDINTIYSVRADKRWVDRSFFVSGRPTYIAMDDVRHKLYVLCREDSDIKIVDLVTDTVTDIINLPMTFKPVYMRVVDLRYAFVIDEFGNLAKIDLESGAILARREIGVGTDYVEHLPDRNTVAVSSGRDSRVYLLDDASLENGIEIAVSGKPTGILAKDDFLYIAEEQSGIVSIYDTRLHRTVKSVFVGLGPRRVIELDDNIYVANARSGTLSLLRTQNQRVLKEIRLGDEVYEMASSTKEKLIYIGKKVQEDCGGSVSVLDINTNSVLGEIEIGAKPLGIVVGQ